MSTQWLEDAHKGLQDVYNVSYKLQDLARSFSHTGNMIVADELFAMADALQQSRDQVHDAIGTCVNEQLVSSQRNSEAILKAALAGSMVGRSDNK